MAVSVNLGPRLQRVAAFVPEGSRLGDIGTDHAYLPIFLWENKKIIKAVAVDVHEGPYRSACAAIESRGLQSVIDVRYGDGLKPIQVGEVDTLTLAGMGGNTMLEIFGARPEILSQVNELILQPQGAEGKVRLTLLQAGWQMKQEEYVAEEGRIYGVMHFSRREGYTLEELQRKVQKWQDRVCEALGDSRWSESLLTKWVWEFGPLALDTPSEELRVLILEQIQALRRNNHEMQKSNQEKVQKRIQEYIMSIKVLEELEKCLFPLV
ncbi:MAG TPA: SAM-dependent methyltransferase [Desulfitobacterium dehalogenans]|uniref:SAM-dependent methyltransferase n=1 Tax=Desulfitobacterium dehalogenans TaxID=36854 RepID=A0A7C7D7Q0_9FIRM|nr:SAM-dependent methyltransferase [Desulfitobacterium dehalogenans]